MSEVAALLAAFHEATGREAAIWEQREGVDSPSLAGASSKEFGAHTRDGALSREVTSWAREHRLTLQPVVTTDWSAWVFTE